MNTLLRALTAAIPLIATCDVSLAFAQAVQTPQTFGQIEHASADDCAIIVELGKTKLNWGANPPDFDFFDTFDLSGGGSYREDCRWSDFAVAAPTMGTSNSSKAFYVSRPIYDGGQATASIELTIRPEKESHAVGPDGQIGSSPFIERDTCNLEKQGTRWHLVKCKLDIIT